MGTFGEQVFKRLFFSGFALLYIGMAMSVASSILVTGVIMALVINAVGGTVTYGMCVLASLAVHIVGIGGWLLLEKI
jgi:hypothetical protein